MKDLIPNIVLNFHIVVYFNNIFNIRIIKESSKKL